MTADADSPAPPRWRATVLYRSDAGPIDVEHMLHELDELHDLVELGPSWDAIEYIEIRLIPRRPKLTIEQAEKL